MQAQVRPTVFLAATLAALCAAPLAAQEDPKQKPREPVITIMFTGGTLADFLQEVRGSGEDINIVATDLAADIQLPRMTLKNTSVLASLQAVAQVVPSPYRARIDIQSDGIGKPVFTVEAREQNMQAPGMGVQNQPRSTAVFSLRGLTTPLATDPKGADLALEAKTILSALDAGLSVTDKKSRATLRYHEDSGLLFVNGTRDQTGLVRMTLDSLTIDVDNRRNAAHTMEQRRLAEEQRRQAEEQHRRSQERRQRSREEAQKKKDPK